MPEPERDAQYEVLPGAEPFSADGGTQGVLVLHGFTGSPQSMRGLAEAFAAAGFTVELPLLPGHGTTVEDMATTGWDDWSGAAEMAFQELTQRCDRVVVAGLSMGGALCAWLAAHHPEIAGVVVVNPAIDPPAQSFIDMMRGALEAGTEFMPAVGNDIADPDETELAYDAVPIASLLSLCERGQELYDRLAAITCPVLILNSPQDHVVPPVSSDVLAAKVSGPVERVTLERSYHVATLDYDKAEIETRAVDFARKVTGR
jgi:carboxylesterase